MEDKTLRIIFTGIVTLTPGPPRYDDKPPDKAFVMMAANVDKKRGKRGKQINDWGIEIAEHFPFVSVNCLGLDNPPAPDDGPGRHNGGDCIYYFRDARVKIEPPRRPKKIRLEYFTDPTKPLADRPGSDDVAPPDDIRWLADIRDILQIESKPPQLKKTADPNATYVDDNVAAIVDLDGGTLRASFPCDTLNPKTFIDKDNNVVPGLRRVLASEFIIDIRYPKETARVTLSFHKLRKGAAVTGPAKLVLKWPVGRTTLEVRMGNDTKEEVRRLNTPQRCDPARQTGPVLKPRDDEFDLHYNLMQIPPTVSPPLPSNDPHQCSSEGCKPLMVSNPGGNG
jgi:hypothetical protein